MVELVLVAERGLLLERLDPLLFRVKVARALDIVGVLLQEAELLAVQGLCTLAVDRPRSRDDEGQQPQRAGERDRDAPVLALLFVEFVRDHGALLTKFESYAGARGDRIC